MTEKPRSLAKERIKRARRAARRAGSHILQEVVKRINSITNFNRRRTPPPDLPEQQQRWRDTRGRMEGE